MCYVSFESSDLLTKHFASVHDNENTVNSYVPYENSVTDIASNSISLSNPAVESVIFLKIEFNLYLAKKI